MGRFPVDVMFHLTSDEFENLKSQFATSSWGGRRKLPLAFTEHGAIMAAAVLNSDWGVQMSVYVLFAFVQYPLACIHFRYLKTAQRGSFQANKPSLEAISTHF